MAFSGELLESLRLIPINNSTRKMPLPYPSL
jgi:hypothetical protein